MNDIYEYLMLVASGIVATLSLMVAILKVPKRPELKKFRNARVVFVIAGFMMAILNFACFMVGKVYPFDKMAILATAPYEALLMACIVLIFIDSERVTLKCVLSEFLCITLCVSALYLTHRLFPRIFPYIYIAFSIAYLGQLTAYSIIFAQSYKLAVKRTSDYYSDDYGPRIVWVRRIFVVGVSSALMCFVCLFINGWGYCILVPMYLCTYFLYAAHMIAYAADHSYLTNALKTQAKVAEEEVERKPLNSIPEKTIDEIRDRLEKWIDRKGYMKRDISYADVLEEIGVEVGLMRRYMKDVHGTDFRTWRNRLRIEAAVRILMEYPNSSIEQVSDRVGYNDSSNFHKDFKKRYGISASAYRKMLNSSAVTPPPHRKRIFEIEGFL